MDALALLGIIFGSNTITALVTALINNKKTRADTALTASQTDRTDAEKIRTDAETVDLVTQSAERIIIRLESVIKQMEAENLRLKQRVAELSKELEFLREIVHHRKENP